MAFLKCTCPVKNYRNIIGYIRLSLDTELCTRWVVKFVKGNLACDEQYASEAAPRLDYSEDSPPLQETSEAVPSGDYRYYCTQCTVSSENELSCSCKIPGLIYDSWYNTAIDLNACPSGENIAYANGQLYCDSKTMLNAIGNFTESCRNCIIKGDNLYCLCDKTRCDWSARDLAKTQTPPTSSITKFSKLQLRSD